jgi:hypothetical protein
MRSPAHVAFAGFLSWCVASAGPCDAFGQQVAARDAVAIRLVCRVPHVPLGEARAALRAFVPSAGAVEVDTARRTLDVAVAAVSVPRLAPLIQAMERAQTGDHVWLERLGRTGRATWLAARLTRVLPARASVVGDDETGTLVIVADEPTYLRILEMVKRAPASGGAGEVHVVLLEHAVAADIVRRLEPTLATLRARRPTSPPGTEPPAALRASADEATNAVVLTTATAEETEALRAAVQELDVRPKAMAVEVVFAEVPVDPHRPFQTAAHVAGIDVPDLGGPLPEEARRTLWATRDTAVLDRRVIFMTEGVTTELWVDARGRASSAAAVGYRMALTGWTPSEHVRLQIDTTAYARCSRRVALGVAACEPRRAGTMVILHEEVTGMLPLIERDRIRPPPATSSGAQRVVLFIALTAHRMLDEKTDLKRLFARHLIEAEEARDHETLFGHPSQLGLLRIDRGSAGLVGSIRRAQQGR